MKYPANSIWEFTVIYNVSICSEVFCNSLRYFFIFLKRNHRRAWVLLAVLKIYLEDLRGHCLLTYPYKA